MGYYPVSRIKKKTHANKPQKENITYSMQYKRYRMNDEVVQVITGLKLLKIQYIIFLGKKPKSDLKHSFK